MPAMMVPLVKPGPVEWFGGATSQMSTVDYMRQRPRRHDNVVHCTGYYVERLYTI